MARAAVQAMDQRLAWVERNRAVALTAELQGELRSALQSALHALRLLKSLAADASVCVGSEFGEAFRS